MVVRVTSAFGEAPEFTVSQVKLTAQFNENLGDITVHENATQVAPGIGHMRNEAQPASKSNGARGANCDITDVHAWWPDETRGSRGTNITWVRGLPSLAGTT